MLRYSLQQKSRFECHQQNIEHYCHISFQGKHTLINMCANVPAEFCNLVNNVTCVLYAHIEKSRTHPRKSEVIKSTVKQTVNRLMEAVCWSDAEQMS